MTLSLVKPAAHFGEFATVVNLLLVTSSSSSQPFSQLSSAKLSSAKPSSANSDQSPESLPTEPKRPCRVTVTEPGWQGARSAAIAAGCSSVSDMLEKLGRGELAVIAGDDIQLPKAISQTVPQHVHYHIAPTDKRENAQDEDEAEAEKEEHGRPLPVLLIRFLFTSICATVIVGSVLYIGDRILTLTSNVFNDREQAYLESTNTPTTGDLIAGYTVSDEYGIRPFHPVTGEPNVPHNGVDLAMDIGTPIHAVGKTGDSVTVECWWDVDGGGWVVDQTAQSYPGFTFQSLHMSENGCKQGKAKAGEVIAYSGNSGLGTGAHYDFRVKIDGSYVPPASIYLESAVTGEPPKE